MSPSNDNRPTLGIDFGTTTSAVAVVKNGEPTIIPVENGRPTMPSAVAFTRSGEVITGTEAKKQAVLNPDRTFLSVKRRLGEKAIPSINGENWSFEKIGAEILRTLKSEAEQALNRPVEDAVITVPAYFNDIQRRSVQEIGRLAGLNVVRIINEPTAAAMAYGIELTEERNILVFDFGGGTFDVSILTIADGVFEVIATGGDNHLGGDDIDSLLVDMIAEEIIKERGIDLRQDKMAMQKLRDEAEKAKITLSEKKAADIKLPFISADENGPIHYERTLTIEAFNQTISRIVRRLVNITVETLKNAHMGKNDIDHILLVGGSTRIPMVRETIARNFGEKLVGGINPIECVALGASLQGAILSGDMENKVLVDVIPLSLGVAVDDNRFEPIIVKNTPIPYGQKKIFSTVVDNQTEVELRIFQGNSDHADENVQLGRFVLGDIEIAPQGEPKIEVEFDIDVNGILSVAANDKKTGANRSVTIEKQVVRGNG